MPLNNTTEYTPYPKPGNDFDVVGYWRNKGKIPTWKEWLGNTVYAADMGTSARLKMDYEDLVRQLKNNPVSTQPNTNSTTSIIPTTTGPSDELLKYWNEHAKNFGDWIFKPMWGGSGLSWTNQKTGEFTTDFNKVSSGVTANPTINSTLPTTQNPTQSDMWRDTWQPTGQVNNGNPYSEAWKNISPNIGTKESTPSNTTINTTNPASGQGNFPKLPNITQDVMQELDSLNGVNTWGNFKTTGLGNRTNPNYTESKGYYVNPYTGEYSF